MDKEQGGAAQTEIVAILSAMQTAQHRQRRELRIWLVAGLVLLAVLVEWDSLCFLAYTVRVLMPIWFGF